MRLPVNACVEVVARRILEDLEGFRIVKNNPAVGYKVTGHYISRLIRSLCLDGESPVGGYVRPVLLRVAARVGGETGLMPIIEVRQRNRNSYYLYLIKPPDGELPEGLAGIINIILGGVKAN
jgi:hypothetical protein